MHQKRFRNLVCAALAFSAAAFGQGSVFSGDGGSQTNYFAHVRTGTQYINAQNTGFTVTAPGTGSICVNAYAINTTAGSGGAMALCCSCLVAPNQTTSITISTELQRSPGFVDSANVKLIATVATGSPLTCNPATIIQPQALPFGMTAWKSSVQLAQDGVTDVSTQSAFIPYILGPVEVANLTAQCSTTTIKQCTCQAGSQ
jgi:hypothetical protein